MVGTFQAASSSATLSSFDFNQPTSEEMEAARAATVALKEGSETSKDLELFVAH